MLETLTKNPEVNSFLKHYSKTNWNSCIEAALMYGIQTLQKKYPYGLSHQLLLSITGLDTSLERSQSHAKLRPASEKSKKITKSSQPSQDLQRTSHKRPESSKAMKQSSSRPSLHPNTKKTYTNVPSKIKDDVDKDIAIYKYRMDVQRSSLRDRVDNSETRNSGIQTDRSFSNGGNSKTTHKLKQNNSKIKISEKIREPKTVALETAQNLFKYVSQPKKAPRYDEDTYDYAENKVLKIADQFLKNPVTSYLAKNQGMFSVPHSPKYFERLMSPESNLLSSVEMLSPNYYIDS